MDIFHFAPGIPGLFVASLFAGSLSTISSVLNAMATVVWEDIVKMMFRPAREATDKTATIATKILVVISAAFGIGMAFAFSHAGGTILQMGIAFTGAANAPIFGIFLLGIFFPWTNWIGALVGGIPGFLLPMWISIGAYVTKPPVFKSMYYSVECCAITPGNFTSSYFTSTTDYYTTPTTVVPEVSGGLAKLYALSYLWYFTLGTLTTIVVGLIVSFLTGYTKPRDIDPKLLVPYVDKFWCCFPESCRAKFRCGIDYSKVDETNSTSKFGQPDEPVKVNISYVHPYQTDLNGNDQKPSPDDTKKESFISSKEPPISTENYSNPHSETTDQNVEFDKKVLERLDEIETSQL